MKPLRWNDPDPRCVWGNPNLRWGSPSVLLEPGDPGYVELQPGQPGYVPPEEAPKPKRRRHLPPATAPLSAQTENQNPPYTMSTTLQYDVIPLAGGEYTTRVINREDINTPQLVDLVVAQLAAAGTPLTAEQVTACGTALARVKIDLLAKGHVIRRAFGYETSEIDTGGRHADADFTATNEAMHPTISTRLAPQGQADLEARIVYERRAVKAERAPTIARVYDGTENECDCLTLGGPCRISGPASFGPEPARTATTLGLFVKREGGTEKRLAWSRWTDSDVFASWPATLDGTGPATLRAVVKYDGNSQTSSFIFTTPLEVHSV